MMRKRNAWQFCGENSLKQIVGHVVLYTVKKVKALGRNRQIKQEQARALTDAVFHPVIV